jgi:hypothetical protein
MTIHSGRRKTSLLLAGTLLAASLAPPGIRHHHPLAEGDGASHWHEDGHKTFGGIGHDDTECHNHRAASQHSPVALAGGQWHLHVYLFGFRVTIPDSDPDQGDRSPDEQADLVVWQLGEQPLLRQVTEPNAVQCIAPQLAGSTLGDAAPTQAAVSAPPPVSCAPLCDIARRERSGVLLA